MDSQPELDFSDEESQFHHPPPIPSKPTGGARVLVVVLQALVMAAALLLFFLFAGLAALVLIHLLVAGRALRRRRLPQPCRDPSPASLSRRDLKKLPSSRFGRSPNGGRWSDCAVCLDEFRDGERCRVLPGCGHAFHKGCVDKWLVRKAACPVCRADVGERRN